MAGHGRPWLAMAGMANHGRPWPTFCLFSDLLPANVPCKGSETAEEINNYNPVECAHWVLALAELTQPVKKTRSCRRSERVTSSEVCLQSEIETSVAQPDG